MSVTHLHKGRRAGRLTGKGRPASVELWVFSVTMLNGKFSRIPPPLFVSYRPLPKHSGEDHTHGRARELVLSEGEMD